MTLEKLPQNAAPSGALRLTLSLATFKEEQHEAIPAVYFLLLLSLSAFAIDEGHARYVGGTVQGVPAGVIGHLDTTSATSLIFEQAGNKVEIPYAFIDSYEYSKDVTRHLGVLPAIAVGLVKMRRHSHYFSISYRTETGGPAQIVVLEVSKDMPRTLRAILDTRAPGICTCHSSTDPH